jgi:site-specific recombinase XerD
LRALCNWAEEHSFRPEGSNPARRIEKYKEHPRERFLSPRELQRLGRALDRAERCGAITPWAAGAIRRVRKAALLNDVRIHDLRHSFASVAVAGGLTLPLIGGLLGHRQPQTTARYAHLAADPLNRRRGRRQQDRRSDGGRQGRGKAADEAIEPT